MCTGEVFMCLCAVCMLLGLCQSLGYGLEIDVELSGLRWKVIVSASDDVEEA